LFTHYRDVSKLKKQITEKETKNTGTRKSIFRKRTKNTGA